MSSSLRRPLMSEPQSESQQTGTGTPLPLPHTNPRPNASPQTRTPFEIGEGKGVAVERKPISAPRVGLFDSKKLDGVQDDSPQVIREEYKKLHQALNSIQELPLEIRQKLDLSGIAQLDFTAINKTFDDARASEACSRRLKAACLCLGITATGAMALRGLTAAMFYITSCFQPTACLSPVQVAQCGWEVSKWPALIFGGVAGCMSAIGFNCTKTPNETRLISLQKLIDDSVTRIKHVEEAVKRYKSEERIESGISSSTPSLRNRTSMDRV